MTIERVPPKTPILDAAEDAGGKLGFFAKLARPFRAWAEKRHRARVQREIDKRWHDPIRMQGSGTTLSEADRQRAIAEAFATGRPVVTNAKPRVGEEDL